MYTLLCKGQVLLLGSRDGFDDALNIQNCEDYMPAGRPMCL